MKIHGLIAIWLVALSAIACADDPKLDKLLEDWKADKQKADAKLVRTFDREIGGIKKNRNLDPAVKNQKIEVLKEQKATFEKSGELPNYDNLLRASIAYLDELHDAGKALRIFFAKALDAAAGEGAAFKAVVAARNQWLVQLPPNNLGPRTEFHGSRTFKGGTTVDFHFHVGNLENNVFGGAIWQDVGNVGGKTGWQYQAVMEGNQFILSTRMMLHGSPRQVVFRGYVIGNRVVMTLTQKDGKPLTGDLVSVWKK